MMLPDKYNLRVYGLCLDTQGRILLTDERRNGHLMTKFPGGGHELGEGLGQTLQREFLEETGLAVKSLGLFYINDFLQLSAFNPKEQLISVYYLCKLLDTAGLETVETAFAFEPGDHDQQTFRWVSIAQLDVDVFRFPIDKLVVEKLKQNLPYLLQLAADSDLAAE
jgi:8-oxo-dGTP diphosphatase